MQKYENIGDIFQEIDIQILDRKKSIDRIFEFSTVLFEDFEQSILNIKFAESKNRIFKTVIHD